MNRSQFSFLPAVILTAVLSLWVDHAQGQEVALTPMEAKEVARGYRAEALKIKPVVNDKNENRGLFMKPFSRSECALHQPSVATIYREGRSELLGFDPGLAEFDPVVAESASMTISDTCLLSGSINITRSGSFTNSSFFTSGT